MIEQLSTSLVSLSGAILSSDLLDLFLHLVVTLVGGIEWLLSDTVLNFLAQGNCSRDSCPGSFYLPITASWANIGYMTHADFVYFVWNTSFGLWAALFYAVGATGALISVAINQPPRTYMWFFLGPPIYAFLVGTPTSVQGVAWRMAGRDFSMEQVWRDAETGMANTALVRDLGLQTNRRRGPSGSYQVAWPMVFLDGLFSEATNNLVSWVGMQRREGRGGAESNLFNPETEEGPWQLLANLKWGLVENIVGVSARDPDVRDALVTFLTSECGDQFKKGVNSGAYSAAAQSRGANLPKTVFIGAEPSTAGTSDTVSFSAQAYADFVRGLDTEAIPTPRSMVRLFNAPAITGSFRQFSSLFSGTQAYDNGRLTDIVCSEYLYMIIQAMRWESGHSYHQLLRSFPDGFTTAESALKTLFYGWNLREQEEASLVEGPELVKYTKHLILVHMIRNELMFAPQVTEQGQRFAPAEQARNYTDGYVRQQGSRAKYGELYQWAVMMPHVQGVLAYLVLIGYPFAAMLMVIPGYWKAFFTWVSFFAWVKLWDVGFAIVHTLERSVWAMIGNHSAMARVGRRLIQTAEAAGSDVQVNCTAGGANGGTTSAENTPRLAELCSVPEVKEAGAFDEDKAWFLFDQAMLLSGSLDLDLSNGYYIYIMAALYFAVPTVTGQLVLGAKAGLGGIATQALGQQAGEAGGAAKSGVVGENINKISTNAGSLDQAARGQSYRKSGLAKQTLDAQNSALDAETQGEAIGIKGAAYGAAGGAKEQSIKSLGGQAGHFEAVKGVVKNNPKLATWGGIVGIVAPDPSPSSTGAGQSPGSSSDRSSAESSRSAEGLTTAPSAQNPSNSEGTTAVEGQPTSESTTSTPPSSSQTAPVKALQAGAVFVAGSRIGRPALNQLGNMASFGFSGMNNHFSQDMFNAQASAAAAGLDLGMQKSRNGLAKSGFGAYGASLGAEADFEASSAAWDTKNAFATHMAGMAGINGGNPGGLAPGVKPSEMRQLAGGGVLGTETRNASHYGGFGFMTGVDSMISRNRSNGSQLYMNNWKPWGFESAVGTAIATGYYQMTETPQAVMKVGAGYISNAENFTTDGQKGDQLQVFSGMTQAPNLDNIARGPVTANGAEQMGAGALGVAERSAEEFIKNNSTTATTESQSTPK